MEGGEYFKLEHSNEEFGTVTVNINTLAKARQTLKVKAEVDGVEQVVEFTLIPPQGLMYAGAESPFRQAERPPHPARVSLERQLHQSLLPGAACRL